jgi:hypothetical protein
MDETPTFSIKTYVPEEGDPFEDVGGEILTETIATLDGTEYLRVAGLDEDGGPIDERWFEQPSGKPVPLSLQLHLDNLVLRTSAN